MRIVLVHDGDGALRGSEKVAIDLVTALRAQGFRFHVVTNHREFAAAFDNTICPVTIIPFKRLFLGNSKWGTSTKWRDLVEAFAAFRRFRRLLREFRADVIHINNGGACQWVMPAAWLEGVPAVVHLHAPWSRTMRFLLGLHLPDRIVGVSNAIMAGFRTDPVAAQKLRVIYNGTPAVPVATREERAAARAALNIPDDMFVVAFVSVLIWGKSPGDALAAMDLLPQALKAKSLLLFIGDGEARPELEQAAKGAGHVRFLGQRDDVNLILSRVCDVLVLPSIIEAFSLVLLEAAACGVARIAAAAGGNVESIIDREDGLLFRPHDIQACADAIAALAQNPALRAELGERARLRVEREFSPAHFSEGFVQNYKELCLQPVDRWRRFLRGMASCLNLLGGFHLGASRRSRASEPPLGS